MIHILLKVFGADSDLYSEKCQGCSSGVNDGRKMWNLYLFMYVFTTLKEQRRGKPVCAFFVDLLWRLHHSFGVPCDVICIVDYLMSMIQEL